MGRFIVVYDADGNSVGRESTPQEDANFAALLAKARQAVDANNTFLALVSPTNAQVLAQVQRLTREDTALIKLVLGDVVDASGT